MPFSPQVLQERLDALTAGADVRRWIVSFSGGIDSTVLLHALASGNSRTPIVAHHVDHGLHPDSGRWRDHCEAVARSLGAAFGSTAVSVDDYAGNGPEAAARQARYTALLAVVDEGDWLLSGHHENDQAETLLLNLVRGSGPAGLAGIGARQRFGRGMLLRPMLGVSNGEIADYAARHTLDWQEDPSNIDTRFDRNFLRRDILPRLKARWPAVVNRLRRSAELVGEASDLLDDLADIDLERCGPPDTLSIPALAALSPSRQRNVLRRAARRSGLPSPPATRLHRVVHELIPARSDAQPLVEWPGAAARRYRDSLYLMPAVEASPLPPGTPLTPGVPVPLGPGLGSLALVEAASGIDPALAARGLDIRFREGGEAIRTTRGGPTRKLKKLMQEAGVLPWMRDRLPILTSGGTVVAAGDLWLSAEHTVEGGFVVEWRRKPAILARPAL